VTATQASDLDDYLRSFAAGGYPVDAVRHATCVSCAELTAGFAVALDDEAGAAVRRCVRCQTQVVMLDSQDVLEDAELGDAACPCGHEQFDVAVGFSLREDAAEVRWVSVGLRCRNDGLLGVYTDWKVDYSPSAHLVRDV
jgi:hypothetical protein